MKRGVAIVIATVAAAAAVLWIEPNGLMGPWQPAVALAAPPPPPGGFGVCGIGGNTGHTGFNEEKQLFWGELHLHTMYSLDAYSFGTRTTPDEAYLFAKGNGYQLQINTGTNDAATIGPSIGLTAPLDFVAITDHSEFLSVVQGCASGAAGFAGTQECDDVLSLDAGVQDTVFHRLGPITKTLCGPLGSSPACQAQARDAWRDIQRAARDANDRCRFTSFVAYEWSDVGALNPNATNHRNVIFANANVPPVPLSSALLRTPPMLWNALDLLCTGPCRAITIPHNSNLSDGISLQVWDKSQRGIQQQMKYQVSAEIYQHKGASECLYDPATGYNDADCAFEQIERTKEPALSFGPASFIRHALALGLASSLAKNVNPLQLGFVGGTDGHNGAPGNADEATWSGHDAHRDNTPEARLGDRIDWGPGGLTAVWAKENTRSSLFDAIASRETYATSGPRLQVRVLRTNLPAACSPGYPGTVLSRNHTPMGGTFVRGDLQGRAPNFAIEVWPDATDQLLATSNAGTPGQAAISAVQMIKIHTVVTPGQPPRVVTELPIDVTGGAGFDPTGGCVTWRDPDFDPAEAALYYVRVLQEPTWRWTHLACLQVQANDQINGTTNYHDLGCDGSVTAARPLPVPQTPINERAWTSPIWYDPPGRGVLR